MFVAFGHLMCCYLQYKKQTKKKKHCFGRYLELPNKDKNKQKWPINRKKIAWQYMDPCLMSSCIALLYVCSFT